MDYARYQLEDFVADEYFIKWVKAPSEESNAFWNAWLSKNPQQKTVLQEARQIIQMLDIKEDRPPEGKFLEIWENIIRDDQRVLDVDGESEKHVHEKTKIKWYYQVAASLLFIIVAGASLYLYDHRSKTITTAYGEARTLFLPDSTKVTLNSNSSIRFSASHFTDKRREVWLTGEAFFAVVHKQNHQNFLVHTEQLHVEVLGTKFDVNTRRGKTMVILEEGKVKINLETALSKAVIMQPGDLVEFSNKDKEPTRKTVDTDNYLSWKNNRLVFVSTSLLEIAHLLEDNYGYTVTFENDEITSRRFTGSASSDNIQELLQKLSKVFSLEIKQDNNKLIIQYTKENPRQLSPS